MCYTDVLEETYHTRVTPSNNKLHLRVELLGIIPRLHHERGWRDGARELSPLLGSCTYLSIVVMVWSVLGWSFIRASCGVV
ncbi:unnamed protein product [Choristocarpus tenellus]